MKVALCLSGQPRYLDIGYQHLYKNILSKYDTDVFIHSWFDESMVGKDVQFSIQYNRKAKFEKDADKKLLSIYKPKKYLIEPQKNFNTEDYKSKDFGCVIPLNFFSQFYSLNASNDIFKDYQKQTNQQYDLIVRTRTDVVFEKFELDLNTINSEELHCFGLGVSLQEYPNIEVCNDQFAIGNPSIMNIYSSLYDMLPIYKEDPKLLSFHPERLLTYHLYKNSIPINHCHNILNVNIYKG